MDEKVRASIRFVPAKQVATVLEHALAAEPEKKTQTATRTVHVPQIKNPPHRSIQS